jgi:hypothetical protein
VDHVIRLISNHPNLKALLVKCFAGCDDAGRRNDQRHILDTIVQEQPELEILYIDLLDWSRVTYDKLYEMQNVRVFGSGLRLNNKWYFLEHMEFLQSLFMRRITHLHDVFLLDPAINYWDFDEYVTQELVLLWAGNLRDHRIYRGHIIDVFNDLVNWFLRM